MQTVRDLAEADHWRESLERSKSRRDESSRFKPQSTDPRAARAEPRARRSGASSATSRRERRQAIARRRRLVVRGGTLVVGLLLWGAVLVLALGGHSSPVSPPSAHADVTPASEGYGTVRQGGPTRQIAHVSATAALARPNRCLQVDSSTGYVNPLAGAKVKRERIDMGVDYAGSGTLSAIGAARITHVATDGTGWPGAFIEYQLLEGPDAGCYVYYAEGVTPKPGLKVGDRVRAGQAIVSIIPMWPTGFEVGWGAGTDTKTYAAATHQWSAADDQHDHASPAGKNFSSLIASLGGPPGKVEG